MTEHVKVNGANVVIEGPDETFLLELGSYGRWMLPGGGVERAELPVHAGMDETLEETGLIVAQEDLQLIALLVQKVVRGGQTIPISGIVALYRCDKYDGKLPTEPNDEVVEWKFVTFERALELYQQGKLLRGYMRMLVIYDNIRRGLLKPVYEAILADQVPVRPQLFI
ncbi:MAG: NUDIX hydrolase [Patescibacteria group bacterium]